MRSMSTAKNVSPCKKHSYVGTARSARAPGVGHLPVLLPDEIADTGLSSLSRIERADVLVDFRTQCAQLFDMRE